MVSFFWNFHPESWGRFPFWLRLFKWVETTNQVGVYQKKPKRHCGWHFFFIDWRSIWEIHLWSPLFDKEHNILPFLVSFQPQQTFTFPIPRIPFPLAPPPKKRKQHNTSTRKEITQLNKKNNNTHNTTETPTDLPGGDEPFHPFTSSPSPAAKTALYYAWPRTLVRPSNRMVIPKLQQILGAQWVKRWWIGQRGVSYQTEKHTHTVIFC